MSASDIDAEFQTLHNAIQLSLNGVPFAPSEAEDDDPDKSLFVEGVFMRAYTAFEASVEALFLHYACGGASKTGHRPSTRLSGCSHAEARAIIQAGSRYLDWSSPTDIREKAVRIFVGGEPFYSEVNAVSPVLTEAERVRNRIAHESNEARLGMKAVETSRFLTPRAFPMRAGQLLRARRKSKPAMSIASEHMSTFAGLIQRIASAS